MLILTQFHTSSGLVFRAVLLIRNCKIAMPRRWGALLLVVALLPAIVRTEVIATDAYSCSPATCRPPACMCASNSPPGGLSPSQIPQFVLLSHDNALNDMAYSLMMEVLGNKTQRNGCPVPITWFAMRYHSACSAGRSAMNRGDEVAMQANRFYPADPFTSSDPNPNYDSRDPATGKPSVEIEITMSRKWWNEDCKLSIRNMVGFRAQGYYNNPPIRQTLSKAGYLYDATLVERYYTNSPTSPSANQTLWAYTMDAGIPQECNFFGDTIGKCSLGENYKGLWEAPLYQMQDGDTMYGVSNYGDTTGGGPVVPDLFALFKAQLDTRRTGGRTPLQLSTFFEWLSDKPNPPPADDPKCIYCKRTVSQRARALARFVDYAMAQPDVWFVTYSDLIHWMQNPVPAEQFAAWWDCRTPGVKADLSAVNLTGVQLADGAPSPSPSPSPPTSVVSSPQPSPSPPPSPVQLPPSPAAAPSPSLQASLSAGPSPPAAQSPSLTAVQPEARTDAVEQQASPAPATAPPPSGAFSHSRTSLAAAGVALMLGALVLAL